MPPSIQFLNNQDFDEQRSEVYWDMALINVVASGRHYVSGLVKEPPREYPVKMCSVGRHSYGKSTASSNSMRYGPKKAKSFIPLVD
jgi:hypothetical protein